MGIVWFIGFFGNKRTIQLPHVSAQILANILLFSSPILLFYPFTQSWLALSIFTTSPFLSTMGVILTVSAIAFAIWARVTLGRNWSGVVITLKEHHTLVSSGPYHFVRHPIYTGYFFATLGTALTIGSVASLLATGIIFLGFFMRMKKEEALMINQFPQEYPLYKTRTKKIIPFVW